MIDLDAARTAFSDCFAVEPEFVVWSPGRVNLIGDHTDYNGGLALPMAIDCAITISLSPAADDVTRVYSVQENSWTAFDTRSPSERSPWPGYVHGVANELVDAGFDLHSWVGVVSSSVPAASGLSSSAALELATAMAFCVVSGFEWDPMAMAMAANRAEREWVGMNCGLLDQMASALARQDCAMVVDFQSLDVQWIEMPARASIVIVQSGMERDLIDTPYNTRRLECEAAARKLGVAHLRDVDPRMLGEPKLGLSAIEQARARHVLSENDRVLAFARAIDDGDLEAAGAIMSASHQSLRLDFECSTPELDQLVACAASAPGCHGARMTGGGFGGSVVALVDEAQRHLFLETVLQSYLETSGINTNGFIARPTGGTAAWSSVDMSPTEERS